MAEAGLRAQPPAGLFARQSMHGETFLKKTVDHALAAPWLSGSMIPIARITRYSVVSFPDNAQAAFREAAPNLLSVYPLKPPARRCRPMWRQRSKI